jgi:hypothetical protein
MTTLTCRSCGAKVNIDALAGHATCQYCGNEQILDPEARPSFRPEVPQPKGVSMEIDSGNLHLVQRWFSFRYIPLAFFAVFWDGFLIFWYSMALGSHAPLVFILFPILHLAVGIGITYSVLAGFFNRTILDVTPEFVSVRFQPLPWIGARKLPAAEIRQLYCKEKVIHSKNGTSLRYALYAVTADNKGVKLLSGLDNPDTAVFIEQQLERWMKIPDHPVAGELAR